MGTFATLGLIGLFLGLAATMGYFDQRNKKLRQEALANQAALGGYSFEASPSALAVLQNSGLNLFERGRARQSLNCLKKTEELGEIIIFDYHYTTGGGRHSQHHQQTVFCVESSRLSLPAFSLEPENIFHSFFQMFGYQDIDFTSNPEFSKHYLLRGKDEQRIRSCFNIQVLQHFERVKGLAVEGSENLLIIYYPGTLIAPEEIISFISDCRSVSKTFGAR